MKTKELVEYLEEWAQTDMNAADSLCMHSNNPSKEVFELCEAVVKLTADLEKSGRAIGEVIAGFTKTEEGLREDLARRFDKIKRVCELNDNQSQAMKEAELVIEQASLELQLTKLGYNPITINAAKAFCDEWLAKYGEKK